MATSVRLAQFEQFDPARRPSEPLLFKRSLTEWPAVGRWSPDYLKVVAGAEQVRVAVSKTGHFRYLPDGSAETPAEQEFREGVPFGEAADQIIRDDPTEPKYYVTRFGFSSALPKLLEDLGFPPAADTLAPTLWFGSGGTSSPLHFDGGDNLHCQIYGFKRWVLFPPSDSPFLYPFPERCKVPHLSRLDLAHIDRERFPLFARATPIEVEMEPGDMIFLPAFWWHYVESRSISISVNRWWPQDIRQYSTPNALGTVRAAYRQCLENSEQAQKISAHEWLEAAALVIDTSPRAAVLMAACALCRFSNAAGLSANEQPLAPVVGPTKWAALFESAMDPTTASIARDDAMACLDFARVEVGATTAQHADTR